jgi:NADH-quinone oxidoreductase subunit H
MMQPLIVETIFVLVKIVAVLAVVLLMVAYMTYMERKVIGHMQVRLGPMRVGPHGLLQPIADGLKLILKEDIIPAEADKWVFRLAPVMCLVPALVIYAVIPFDANFVIADINIGILYILSISSLGIYGIVMAGWASNNKYSLMGGFRSAGQMISYEIFLGFSIIGPIMLAGSMNLTEIVKAQEGVWFIFLQPLAFVIYLIAGTAETNRVPFDLPEAESELVAGFHTEYSGMRFAYFFLAEYANMLVVSALATILFLGGWRIPFISSLDIPVAILMILHISAFIFKMLLFMFIFMWLRATYPRFRYDQLMGIGWKVMFPLAIFNIAATGIIYYFVM